MGILIEATCPCGYEGSCSLTSSHRDHGKVFRWAHACADCHQVAGVDLLASPVACPKCGSQAVSLYGLAPGRPRQKTPRGSLTNGWCDVLNRDFHLDGSGQPCPACGQNTLEFRSVGSFF